MKKISDKEKVKRNVITARFSELLSNAKNGEIFTFEMCSEWGVGMGDSTFDKVEMTIDGDIRFYYNENTGDYETIRHFDTDELEAFYDVILDWQRSQEQLKQACHEETIIELSHQLYGYIYGINGNDTVLTINEIKRLADKFDGIWENCDQVENDYLMMIDEFCEKYRKMPK